jgi:type II secretory pathway pseudopilin PulG
MRKLEEVNCTTAPPDPHLGPDAGFGLIEALIAFSILVISLSVLYSGLGLSANGERKAQLMREAATVAQQQIDLLALEPVLQAGVKSGMSQDGYAWKLTIEPKSSTRPSVQTGYWIRVAVSDTAPPLTAAPLVELVTFRLSKPSQSP